MKYIDELSDSHAEDLLNDIPGKIGVCCYIT